MKITNIKIENFRNITKADVSFENINIFTGKNSSGKSNFLLAISNSLKTGTDFYNVFYNNIVTFGKGKSKAVFETTIKDINIKYLIGKAPKAPAFYFSPESFVFQNTFGKKELAPTHQSLLFSGDFTREELTSVSSDTLEQLTLLAKSPNKKTLDKQLVYDRVLVGESTEDQEGKHIIEKVESSGFQDSEKFFDIFSNYEKNIFSWVDSKNFSSTLIYDYVTERIDNNEIYEQVVDFLKKEKSETKNFSSKNNFDKAKFINLLADIQKNEEQTKKFSKELNFYTDGLLDNIYINLDGSVGNKGEIFVNSFNSPKDIFCISAGTAVLIYFIVLKNWVELPYNERNFLKPDIMIFDEIDSIIHPSLMVFFTEVLKAISNNIQLFISTHSPNFIDCFDKNQLFWLKDTITINEKIKLATSSVYSYKSILEKLPDNKYFLSRKNSELFIDGLIDSLFPLI
jgi:predicted ATP-dependent endonuclease of OLD family